MSEGMTSIDTEVLQKVFDTAVHSMDFGSGFLDDDEVEALRACAVALGVDPAVATPRNFVCKYGGTHLWGKNWGGGEWSRPHPGARSTVPGVMKRMCVYCNKVETREMTPEEAAEPSGKAGGKK